MTVLRRFLRDRASDVSCAITFTTRTTHAVRHIIMRTTLRCALTLSGEQRCAARTELHCAHDPSLCAYSSCECSAGTIAKSGRFSQSWTFLSSQLRLNLHTGLACTWS